MAEPKKLSIESDNGSPQPYVIIPHPAGEGFRLATRLFAMAGPALGHLADVALSGKLDERLDMAAIVSELASAAASADAPGLLRDLFRHTHRAGLDMGSTALFDSAYQANYGELAEAAIAIVEANGFARFFVRFARRAGASLRAGRE